MAILYTGCACTERMPGNSFKLDNPMVVIENRLGSSVLVNVRRIALQMDSQAFALTSVMPQVKLYRGSGTLAAQSGVGLVSKGTFDSSQTSSPYVFIYRDNLPDGYGVGGLALTPSGAVYWQQYIQRMHTLVGQVLGADGSILPQLIEDVGTFDFLLYPNQYIMVQVEPTSIGNNPPDNQWFFNMVWTEETLPTYTISGTVSSSGTPVDGAEVTVVVADDTDMTNAYLHSVQVTAGGGLWSADIPIGKLAYAYAQNYSGGTYYTAPGNPYVTNA